MVPNRPSQCSWDVRVCIRRPSCPSVVRRTPRTRTSCQTWEKAIGHGPQGQIYIARHNCISISSLQQILVRACHVWAPDGESATYTIKSKKDKSEQDNVCKVISPLQASRETVSRQRKLVAKRLNSVSVHIGFVNVHNKKLCVVQATNTRNRDARMPRKKWRRSKDFPVASKGRRVKDAVPGREDGKDAVTQGEMQPPNANGGMQILDTWGLTLTSPSSTTSKRPSTTSTQSSRERSHVKWTKLEQCSLPHLWRL